MGAYRKGLELNKAMGVNFEKERKILAGMRDQIRKLIDQKQHKLNQLLAQIERIKGAMADDDYDAAKKSLSEHLQIVGKSCAGMTTFAKQEKGALEKVLSSLEPPLSSSMPITLQPLHRATPSPHNKA